MFRPPPSALDRRRIRSITPENAGKVISRDIYWSVPFLELYLEKCDAVAFERPADAFRIAHHAPGLADWIGIGRRQGEYPTEDVKRSYRIRARSVFASTCFRIGQIAEARTQYENARLLLEARDADGDDMRYAKADFLMRWGNFHTKTRERGDDEGLRLLNEALELLTELQAPDLSAGLTLRGSWFWYAGQNQRAAIDWAQALSIASKHPNNAPSRRILIAALGNLSLLLAQTTLYVLDQDRVLALIHQARKRLASQHLSAIKAKLHWIEGTLNRRLQLDRAALRLLEKARDGFRELKMPEEYLIVSLEKAIILESQGDALDVLREEVTETLSELHAEQALLEIASGWCRQATRGCLAQALQACSNAAHPVALQSM